MYMSVLGASVSAFCRHSCTSYRTVMALGSKQQRLVDIALFDRNLGCWPKTLNTFSIHNFFALAISCHILPSLAQDQKHAILCYTESLAGIFRCFSPSLLLCFLFHRLLSTCRILLRRQTFGWSAWSGALATIGTRGTSKDGQKDGRTGKILMYW